MESYIHCTLFSLFGVTAALCYIIWFSIAKQLAGERRIKQFIIHFVILICYLSMVITKLFMFFENKKHDNYEETLASRQKEIIFAGCSGCCFGIVLRIFGLPEFIDETLKYIAQMLDNMTQELRIKSFALSRAKELSMCHLALFLIIFGYQSTFMSTVITVYTAWDLYVTQTLTWRTIEDYYEKWIDEFYVASLTNFCDMHFKIPDGLEPGFEYEIHNVEIRGFTIVRFTIDTQFTPEFGYEAARNIILFNGCIELEDDWIPLPSALAG